MSLLVLGGRGYNLIGMPGEGDVLGGKYRLERLLGCGGFAMVWAARNIKIDRLVALKILSDVASHNPELVERLKREAMLSAKELHPTVVRVEDIGETERGVPYLVMELVRGRTLSVELEGGAPLSPSRCYEITCSILEGLSAAHASGIIHRDIKPSNIMLVDPEASSGPLVRILDMGIAKSYGDDDQLTTTNQVIGTLRYLPPEVLLGTGEKRWTPAVDVFAVGMVLFFMLTGEMPFDVVQANESLQRVLFLIKHYEKLMIDGARLTSPKDVNDRLPETLATVVGRALELNPKDRYRHAAQMLTALEEAWASLSLEDFEGCTLAPTPAARRPSSKDETTTPSDAAGETKSTAREFPVVRKARTPAETDTLDSTDAPDPPDPTHPSGPDPKTLDGNDGSVGAKKPRARRGTVAAALGLAAITIIGGGLLVWYLTSSEGPSTVSHSPSGLVSAAETGRDAADEEHESSRTRVASEGEVGRAAIPQIARTENETVDLLKVQLTGLPHHAEASFAGRVVTSGWIVGEAGERDLLQVRAKGYVPYREEVTLEKGLTIDLAGKLKRTKSPAGTRGNRRKGTSDEFIRGDRGTKIFSQPLELD